MTGKRYLSSICLALTLITQLTPVTAAQSAWYKVAGAEGDFTVEFPSQPIYKVMPVPGTGEQLQTYHFAYGNNYLSFTYIDLRLPPVNAKAPTIVRLEQYTRDYSKTIIDAGGQVLMRTALPDDGMEFISKFPAGKSREIPYEQSRVYFRGARRYVLSCTSLSTSGIDQPFARRFFSSFHLYGTPGPGGVDKGARKAAPSTPTVNPAEAHWYRFTSLDEDFEAEFPDKPHYDTKAHPVTGTQMQSVSFHLGEYDFSVQSSEIVPPLTTSAERERWFAGAAERFLRGSESRLIRQTRLANGALQIESEREINGRLLFIRVRAYVNGSRGYVVTCSVFSQSPSALDESSPTRFFNSFRLR